MSLWSDVTLADPPVDGRARELWVQNVAGYILMHDVRARGLEVAAGGDDEARALAERAVDAVMMGLAQVFDGVTGAVRNDEWTVDLRGHARLVRGGLAGDPDDPDDVVVDLDLFQGDGVGTGMVGWMEQDFGPDRLFARPDGAP